MRNNMQKKDHSLRHKILQYFIICSFLVAVVESVIDSVFDDLLFPMLYANADKGRMGFPHLIYLFLSFLIFVFGALLFYLFAKNAIREESIRQVKIQNFLYSAIAHDLKTPMTSVLGFSSALKDGKIKLEEQNEIFDIIYMKSRHMNELVDALLAYSRLGTGEYILKKETVDLAALVREVAADNYLEFENRGISLDIAIEDGKILVLGDGLELKRAIGNLVINAWKHNKKGTRVRISTECPEKEAIISIADSGEDISPECRKTIFEPFVIADHSRGQRSGNGLGLAISDKIIAMHKGQLSIEDTGPDYTKAFVISGIPVEQNEEA